MARLFADENFPVPVVQELRRLGHDVHFIHLHSAHPDHGGIIACTFDADFAGQAGRIHAAIAAEGSLAGRLLRVNRSAP